MQNRNIIFLSIIILSSCVVNHNFKIANSTASKSLKSTSGVYYLPQTKIYIEINALKNIHIKGPYQEYAKKYLGIDIKEKSENWSIENINITTQDEIDSKNFYLIQTKEMEDLNKSLLSLKEQGLILLNPPYTTTTTTTNNNNNNNNSNTKRAYNNKMYLPLIKRNVYEKKDTLYKTILTDSAYVKVPVIKKYKAFKSIEQNAKEASEFIIKIRKRRFTLISGQYENYQKKDALDLSIKELNKLEDEYLSLFIGRYHQEAQQFCYNITPEVDSTGSIQIPICCYSKEMGFGKIEENCNPLFLSITKINDYSALENIKPNMKNGAYKNTLLYRIPGKALVKLFNSENTFSNISLKIEQFGTVVPYNIGKIKAK